MCVDGPPTRILKAGPILSHHLLILMFLVFFSLNVQLDPRLLGGTVIEIDGFRLDNSILGNLEQLSYHMKGAR